MGGPVHEAPANAGSGEGHVLYNEKKYIYKKEHHLWKVMRLP